MSHRTFLAAALAAAVLGFGMASAPVRASAQSSLTDQLLYDVHKGNLKAVRRDLANGADVNAGADGDLTDQEYISGKLTDDVLFASKGDTALTVAATDNHADVARLLIAHGADVDARSGNGWTPLFTATEILNDNADVIHVLLDHGADANARDDGSGTTALMNAAENGYADIVRLLLEHGADVSARDDLGDTVLDCKTDENVIHVLQANGAGHGAEDCP